MGEQLGQARKSRWGCIPVLLVLLVGCAIISDDDDDDDAPVPTMFYVRTEVLNVRADPGLSAEVVAQVRRGTEIIPTHTSGEWYGAAMTDGTVGWVHRDFLSAAPVKVK